MPRKTRPTLAEATDIAVAIVRAFGYDVSAADIAAAQALVSAPVVSAPAAARVAQPTLNAAWVESGRQCTCGHEHARPVRSDLRARLAHETACHIKGCFTGCNS